MADPTDIPAPLQAIGQFLRWVVRPALIVAGIVIGVRTGNWFVAALVGGLAAFAGVFILFMLVGLLFMSSTQNDT